MVVGATDRFIPPIGVLSIYPLTHSLEPPNCWGGLLFGKTTGLNVEYRASAKEDFTYLRETPQMQCHNTGEMYIHSVQTNTELEREVDCSLSD